MPQLQLTLSQFLMNERFTINYYDAEYVTNDITSMFLEIFKLTMQNTVIKHLKVKDLVTKQYDTYYVYHTGNNRYIDSKIKSQYPSLPILPSERHLFFFKLVNGKTDCDVYGGMKISDILPKEVEINQYTIQYYHVLNNTEKILSKNEFHEFFS